MQFGAKIRQLLKKLIFVYYNNKQQKSYKWQH